MRYKEQTVYGWGRYPGASTRLYRPEKLRDFHPPEKTCLVRGSGRSYGDASLNKNGATLLSERMNRFVHFDTEQGLLQCESGLTLRELLEVTVAHGWFLPVVPGTAEVTVGGCIAADIHGKNQHHYGNFSHSLINLEVLKANGEPELLNRVDNSELYQATIGGMGLTGIITRVSLQLVPIESACLTTNVMATRSLPELLELFDNPDMDDAYTVAWIDCLNHARQGYRGIWFSGHHSTMNETDHKGRTPEKIEPGSAEAIKAARMRKPGKLLSKFPAGTMNRHTLSHYNQRYYRKHAKLSANRLTRYDEFFFPLDRHQHWNLLYGRKGFVQYQFVVPPENALTAINEILAALEYAGIPVYLAVLKKFRRQQAGLLSFPDEGFTLALDLPVGNPALNETLDTCDRTVIQHGGRVYLAKDARLGSEAFRQMYPAHAQWHKIKLEHDPDLVFQSDLYRRLFDPEQSPGTKS